MAMPNITGAILSNVANYVSRWNLIDFSELNKPSLVFLTTLSEIVFTKSVTRRKKILFTIM